MIIAGQVNEQPAYVTQSIRLRFLRESGEPDMHLFTTFRVRGPLDVVRLHVAVRRLVQRRDSLRSYFTFRDERAWQCFLPPGEGPELQVRDLPRAGEALTWFRDAVHAPFPLLLGPTSRFGLARLGPTEHLLCVAGTYNVVDGHSMDLIMNDLAALYARTPPGRAPAFAAWARRRTRHLIEVKRANQDFWTRQFPGPPPGARLPPALPSPRSSIIAPARYLRAATVRALRRLAAAHEVSLYVVLLAAVHLVRSAEQDVHDLTYAVNVANRDDADAETTVGCLTHRVLVRIDDDGAELGILLRRVRDTLLTVLSHAATPFRVVRSWLAEEHGTQTPECALTYVVLGREWGADLRLPGLDVERVVPDAVDPGSAGLEFWFSEVGTGISLTLRHPPAHYSAAMAARLVDQVDEVLDRLAYSPLG
ncbi:condensation domain-containing protein [Pseudonocardia spinosispora]|uniref:condensation domain-containing protein n=1 Tax=Pseudonocardia spinosispora TaxID=103441 RepID=UPI0004006A7D|nr:condensation domain-containing protein [Pseudonocardia spinosispora]